MTELSSDGRMTLKETHDYWHQIQGQLFLTGTQCCDLVLWTPKDLQIVRIVKDMSWSPNISLMKMTPVLDSLDAQNHQACDSCDLEKFKIYPYNRFTSLLIQPAYKSNKTTGLQVHQYNRFTCLPIKQVYKSTNPPSLQSKTTTSLHVYTYNRFIVYQYKRIKSLPIQGVHILPIQQYGKQMRYNVVYFISSSSSVVYRSGRFLSLFRVSPRILTALILKLNYTKK
ncbi:hypothetical protein KUTeg_002845 [Tegillarca granosa]|uniref:Uncharacterized protein n=1 Tax=Tegillarca granosa TaxID=220873 RepID=A0ABQ9FTX8_TEGGR|nr:hypothetical protein KUTeg_002845 [Tegillarca granosa]